MVDLEAEGEGGGEREKVGGEVKGREGVEMEVGGAQ